MHQTYHQFWTADISVYLFSAQTYGLKSNKIIIGLVQTAVTKYSNEQPRVLYKVLQITVYCSGSDRKFLLIMLAPTICIILDENIKVLQ